MKQADAFAQIDGCALMFEAARSAVAYFEQQSVLHPSLMLNRSFKRSDVRAGMLDLETTYFIRLFTRFEGVLRDYWLYGRLRATQPPVSDMMNSVAAHRHMPTNILTDAHAVRRVRNDIVHPGATNQASITIKQAKSFLNKYLSHLPRNW